LLRLYQEGTVGSLFWTWLVAMAAGQLVVNRSLSKTWRGLLLALILLTFWVSFGQSARWVSGWLPPAVALGVIVCVSRPLVGIPSILGASVLAYWQRDWLIQDVVIENAYSLMTRIEAWKIVSQIVEASPVLGSGPANYYWYASVYPILGWYVPFSSHNQYLDLAAQLGLLGLALFLWFAWRTGRVAWKGARRGAFGFERAYALGAFGGLCGSLAAGALADWILPFVYNTGLRAVSSSTLFWLFLGGVMSLERLTSTVAAVDSEAQVQSEIEPARIGMVP
jgi:O-antigen ligase